MPDPLNTAGYIRLLSPAPGRQYWTRRGNLYTADEDGYLSGVKQEDVQELMQSGLQYGEYVADAVAVGPGIGVQGLESATGQPPPPEEPLPDPDPEPPSVIEVPYIEGEGIEGATLTCTAGTWEGEPESYSYQWLRDQETEIGTDDASYVTVSGDVGHTVGCVVTATNPVGSESAPLSNLISIA